MSTSSLLLSCEHHKQNISSCSTTLGALAGPPIQKGRTKKLLIQAALAGGLASGSTTLMMYPLDTLKTRVQSAAGASVAGIVRSAPSIGLRGLYRCGPLGCNIALLHFLACATS